MPHGNAKNNPKLHHLYKIQDSEEDEIFKFGISDKPIGADNYSLRMREQVDYLNRAVGWLRFFAEILMRNIVGRAKALDIENEHIDAFFREKGRNPRGNTD
jgi:hypothetical protein